MDIFEKCAHKSLADEAREAGVYTDLILKHRQYPIAAGDAYNRITGQ